MAIVSTISLFSVVIGMVIMSSILAFALIIRKIYSAREASHAAFRTLAKNNHYFTAQGKGKQLLVEGVYKGLAFNASTSVRINRNMSIFLYVVQVKSSIALPTTEFLPKTSSGLQQGLHSWSYPPVSIFLETPYRVFSVNQYFAKALDEAGLSDWLQLLPEPVVITLHEHTIEASIRDGFESWSSKNIEAHLEFFVKLHDAIQKLTPAQWAKINDSMVRYL